MILQQAPHSLTVRRHALIFLATSEKPQNNTSCTAWALKEASQPAARSCHATPTFPLGHADRSQSEAAQCAFTRSLRPPELVDGRRSHDALALRRRRHGRPGAAAALLRARRSAERRRRVTREDRNMNGTWVEEQQKKGLDDWEGRGSGSSFTGAEGRRQWGGIITLHVLHIC